MPNNKYSGTHTQTFLFWRPRDEIMVNPLHISKKSISSSNCKIDNFSVTPLYKFLQLQQNRFQAWSPVWGGGGGVPSRKYQKEQGLQTWEQQPGAFLTQFCRTKDRPIEFWYLVPGKSTKIISGNIRRGAGSNNLRRNIINKCLPLFVAYNVCLIVWRSSNLLLYIFRYPSWQEEHQATT